MKRLEEEKALRLQREEELRIQKENFNKINSQKVQSRAKQTLNNVVSHKRAEMEDKLY